MFHKPVTLALGGLSVDIEFGQCLLSQLLYAKRMQQQELSTKTGITRNQICLYCNNVRKMSLKNAVLIAYALNCKIEDLYEFIILNK
jgi:putative transcriptional regulator